MAGAIFAAASVAQAGIIIPAGDWTLDIGGNVNAYSTWTRNTGNLTLGTGPLGIANDGNIKSINNITTGLLPNYLSVSGTTRQNDLDVAFTISINPGASTQSSLYQGSQQENRQAFMTFGDKSWGSFKLGKDLGIFASDAILNDMTLLGVGAGAGALAGNTTTLGRIGTGYMYADWKSQIAYTTPNFSGFQATAGITQAFDSVDGLGGGSGTTSSRGGASPAYEGKASYSFSSSDLTGKIWVSAIGQNMKNVGSTAGGRANETAWATDIGANLNAAGFGLTGYYYYGEGIGQTGQFRDGFDLAGKKRDSQGGYVQATYVLPTKTKIGASWGQSKIDATSLDKAATNWLTGVTANDLTDEMWAVGAYHPLTKHLNLVAEYARTERSLATTAGDVTGKSQTVSAGAILFF